MKNLISPALSFFVNQYLINDVSPDSQTQCIKYYKMYNHYNYYTNIHTIQIPDNIHNVSLSFRKVFNNSFSQFVSLHFEAWPAHIYGFLSNGPKFRWHESNFRTLRWFTQILKAVSTRDSGIHVEWHRWLDRALRARLGTARGHGLDPVRRRGIGAPWLSSVCRCVPEAPPHGSKGSWGTVGPTFTVRSQTALGEWGVGGVALPTFQLWLHSKCNVTTKIMEFWGFNRR